MSSETPDPVDETEAEVEDVEHVESGGSSWRDTVEEFIGEVSSRNWLAGVQGVAVAFLVLPLALLSPLVTVLPPTWRLYHKIHQWSAWQMQKASRADALANVRHPSNKEDVLPAQFVESSEDENDRTGWKIKTLGDKRFSTGVQGGKSARMGKADIVHINEDDLKQGTWTEAVMDSAFATDRERYLFRNAQVRAESVTLDATRGQGNGALPDGGIQTLDVSVERPGVLEDILVPLNSEAGYDGQQVSWVQYSQIAQESADQETVRQAKNSGWMAAKMDDINGVDLFKWVLILGAIGAILLFHAEIGAAIAGFGGGDAVGDAVSGGSGLGMISSAKFALGMG